jgi:hypothetical protein
MGRALAIVLTYSRRATSSLATYKDERRETLVDPQHPIDKEAPRIVGPPEPQDKMDTIQHAVGKTIDSVEFGRAERHERVHHSEVIVLHFTDGTAFSIAVGSNASNLSGEASGLSPGDFHTDLMVFWGDRPHPAW